MTQAKVAFLILSNDRERVTPGLTMAMRMKANRGADVRVMFFGPGVRLAASGEIDELINGLVEAGISPKACTNNVATYGVSEEMGTKPIELLAAGAEMEFYALNGYTVVSF